MSITLPIVDLSSAVIGQSATVSWAAQGSAAQLQSGPGDTATLWIFNESQCGLQLAFQTGEQPFLPAGGWVPMVLQPSCLSYTYTVKYVMDGPLVSSLVTVWFAPGEQVPPVPILGNSPIGGSVQSNVTSAEFLQGAGQSLTLSEEDISGTATLIPGASANIGVALAANGPTGTPQVALQTIGGASPEVQINGELFVVTGSLELGMQNGQMVFYRNDALAGGGLPAIVELVENQTVTSTALQTLVTHTALAQATYRASGYFVANNSVSGNAITMAVQFTDVTGSSRSPAFVIPVGNNGVTANGVNSIGNGAFTGASIIFTVKASTTISLLYRDPTNTPNDKVTVMLERIS